MKLKRNYKLLVISIIIFYSFSASQFSEDYNQYLKLKKDGIVTGTKVKYEKKLFSWFYILEFTTIDGEKVIKEGKCGNYTECKSYYDNLKVIYSPDKPNDFLELPDFNKYSLGYKIFFYFGLYGITGSFIVFIIFNVIIFFKKKDSRDEFLNILKHRSIIAKNT